MKDITTKIVTILQKYKIKKVAFFGSYASVKHNSDSDLDILVEYHEDMDLRKQRRH